MAFVGKNGEGKSTLVKCIMGEIPFTGMLKIGHNVKIGYFAQNQAQLLDESLTVFDTIDHVAVGDIRTKIRDILGAFMFGGEASEKKVKVLSGGEKTRLAMIRLLLQPMNLLILDEPTNHLDMKTKDILKQAIKDFDGTVIVVSHDREFLDGLVEKVYEFGGGKVRECLGGIYEFLEKKKIASLQELELSKSHGTGTGKPAADTTAGTTPAKQPDAPATTAHLRRAARTRKNAAPCHQKGRRGRSKSLTGRTGDSRHRGTYCSRRNSRRHLHPAPGKDTRNGNGNVAMGTCIAGTRRTQSPFLKRPDNRHCR